LAIAALALPSPVLTGDWPDPSLIRADGEQVAVTTSGPWAPSMRIMRTTDLTRWRITGAVFRRPPRWVKRNFWAPEIIRLGDGYAVFYSALPRRRKTWFCLGVATAPTPEGPWRDRGRPLRCGRSGSIDPFPTRDEQGRLHLLWKADGNQFDRPTPIFAQRLREDGRKLLGRPRELIRNDRPWERKVVEAPAVIRRPDGFFYLLYSGNLCCTRRCSYAVGVARAPRLLGPWRKYSGNPILRGGNGWRCPGHPGIAEDDEGGLTAVFHAFRGGDGFLTGRQLLTAPLTFGAEGWPAIGEGRPPALAPGAASASFTDDFAGPLAPEWEWPMERVPGIRTAGGLVLRAARRDRGSGEEGTRTDAGVLVRRIGSSSYTATAVLDRAGLRGEARGGLAAYRGGPDAIGLATGRARAFVWERAGGRFRRLASVRAPRSPSVHLRMLARGRRYLFEVSPDGSTWRRVGRTVRGAGRDTTRLALTAGGQRRAAVRFASAALEELAQR